MEDVGRTHLEKEWNWVNCTFHIFLYENSFVKCKEVFLIKEKDEITKADA